MCCGSNYGDGCQGTGCRSPKCLSDKSLQGTAHPVFAGPCANYARGIRTHILVSQFDGYMQA